MSIKLKPLPIEINDKPFYLSFEVEFTGEVTKEDIEKEEKGIIEQMIELGMTNPIRY